jgi:7,8-dihydropterin-6-yl-methyl-4-(beta-D-ribofuranosyl)aminobenzene 5'-phosphate synthase
MAESTHITILMDNNAAEPSLRTEHGLSMWIEIGDTRILWDTGQSEGLFDNARRLGIDLSAADAIALSHGHYDHTGGLARAIQSATTAAVYLHPKAAAPKYSFKNGVSRFIGTSREAQQYVSDRNAAGGVVYVNGKTEILGGVWLTGPVPRTTPYEKHRRTILHRPGVHRPRRPARRPVPLFCILQRHGCCAGVAPIRASSISLTR